MMHFPPLFQISPCFRKFLRFFEKFLTFRFSSAKISDDLFLVIDHKFWIPPYFPSFSTFLPLIAKNSYFPPTFTNFPPVFGKFTSFLHPFCVFFLPTLAMMHLCITQCTYWTPLGLFAVGSKLFS